MRLVFTDITETIQTLAGDGLGLVGLLVVIVTPIFPLSFESTSAFRFRSIRAKSGLRSSLLELFELSFSGASVAGVGVLGVVSSVPITNIIFFHSKFHKF